MSFGENGNIVLCDSKKILFDKNKKHAYCENIQESRRYPTLS